MTATGAVGFGALLRRLRLAAGLTQEALAERAGVSAKAVSELERDPTRAPRLDTVALLADALGLDPDGRARLLAAARPDSAPPAPPATAAVTPQSLPRPLTPLLGRDDAAAAVAALLRDGVRLLTLTGPGGVGKTRLAIEVAGRAAGDFAAGVAFLDLTPLHDAPLVLPTVAQGFGVDERERVPQRERLIAALRDRHLLLVLDNLERVVAAGPDLLALLEGCPRLTILATSRVALRVRGEREWRVAPLDLPEEVGTPEALAAAPAAALFLERARAVGAELRPDAGTAPTVAAICRRLDGLPLAIELAAAWARLLSPPAILSRLDQRLPLLVGGAHDLPARQRTMRDTIAWSHALLTEGERRLFRRFSVFAGGSTAEAAEAVCADAGEGPATLAGLAGLVDKSLILSREGVGAGTPEARLVMLETIREYGLEQLIESGEAEAVRRRHAALYLALAEAAEPELGGPHAPAWGARLEREHDNLRAALRAAIDGGDVETALRLVGALWRFWSERGHLGEGRRWLREALAAGAGAGGLAPAARGKALIGAATLATEQGAYDEAADLCAEAVALARGRGAGRDLVGALNVQGTLARVRNEYRAAAGHHEEARALARAIGDRAGEAAALDGLAYAATFAGDVAGGNALAEESLTIFRELGNARGLAEALVGLATQVSHAGDLARAEALAAEALALFRGLGDTGRMADALWVLAVAAQLEGRHDRATARHEECLALCRGRGDALGAVQPLTALGMIALEGGEHARARALVEETLTTLRRYDDRWSRAMSLTILGHVELATGDLARAVDHLAEGAALFRAIGNLLYLPWSLEGLAGVAAARGRPELAARLCGARDALQAALGAPLPPAHPAGHAATLAAVRAALGDEAFAAAQAAGRALPSERAIEEALLLVTGGD